VTATELNDLLARKSLCVAHDVRMLSKLRLEFKLAFIELEQAS
jgi:hypothetical protein